MAGDVFIDGRPADVADLAQAALTNYGAYTSFVVENGGVRGLSLHLDRLQASAVELFGLTPPRDDLRRAMVDAVGSRGNAWLRVSLFSPHVGARSPDAVVRPRVMVGVFDRPEPLADGLRVQVQTYEREAPHLKHLATFGLIRARRRAHEAGFGDALFVDRKERVLEGSLWNLVLRRGDTVVWPKGPKLTGVTQALIRQGLDRLGMSQADEVVRHADLATFQAVALCNAATPTAAIAQIDAVRFARDTTWIDVLRRAWASNPPEPIG